MASIDQAMEKILNVSTGHIPKHTADALGSPESKDKPQLWDTLSYVYYHEYGWIIFADANAEIRESHKELADLLIFAKNNGATYLKLDCDAETLDGIPTFDW